MSQGRYPAWRAALIAEYAADKVAAGSWPAGDAVRLATESTQTLLPDGPDTPEHHLFSGLADDGTEVGTLWLWTDRSQAASPHAFLYDIAVDVSRRGQGWGRALLAAGDAWCRRAGMTEVGLHVFAANTAALELYRSAGYVVTDDQVTDFQMRKVL